MNDNNYRILVILRRADRPRHWTFNCPNCQMPVRELDDEVSIVTDIFNADDKGRATTCGKGWCRIHWYFELSQKA